MNKLFTLFLVFCTSVLCAQTFNNFSAVPIPPNGQTQVIPIQVSGLPNAVNGGFGAIQVRVGITHPSVQEVEIKLKAPDNTIITLSTSVGGQFGQDYRNTRFRNDGLYNIEQGTPPFNGTYIPMEDINKVNNGQNPNATWFLLVTDTYPYANNGSFDSVRLTFGNNPPAYPPSVFVCPTCQCPPGVTDCDLLPDMTSSELVIINDMIESPGSLLIGNGTPNIGLGPIEVRPVDSCFCGLVQVPCTQNTCPSNVPVTQRLHQRIYRKHAGNDTLTYYDVSAGEMSYHPQHGHIHVDNWADFTLREKTTDPDPRNWPIIGTSVKQSYCLINLSSCDGYPGACEDNNGLPLSLQSQFVNYGLGYLSGCGKFQGIFPGKLDIYSSGLNAPINLQSICNGEYYIVSITDPDSVFVDADYSNNVVAVPIQLTQQVPASNASFTSLQNGASVQVNATGLLPGTTYIWDFGDGSPYVTQNPTSHTYTANGEYIITLWVTTPCGDRFGYDTVKITGLTQPNGLSNTEPITNFIAVHPNPVSDLIALQVNLQQDAPYVVSLLNVSGSRRELGTYQGGKGLQTHRFNTTDLGVSAGAYFIEIRQGENVFTKKLMVVR